jgi:hypothetical protein
VVGFGTTTLPIFTSQIARIIGLSHYSWPEKYILNALSKHFLKNKNQKIYKLEKDFKAYQFKRQTCYRTINKACKWPCHRTITPAGQWALL